MDINSRESRMDNSNSRMESVIISLGINSSNNRLNIMLVMM